VNALALSDQNRAGQPNNAAAAANTASATAPVQLGPTAVAATQYRLWSSMTLRILTPLPSARVQSVSSSAQHSLARSAV
jgi:hypothetical protein